MKIFNLSLVVLSLSFVLPAAYGASKRVDVKKLEKRYWTPKDKKFSVIQKRKYSKSGKFALSAQGGLSLIEPWSEGYNFDAGLAYYLSERLGLEVQYTESFLKDNETVEELKQFSTGAAANHGKYKRFIGLYGRWVPLYAKMSFLTSSIIYFDMSIGLGGGYTTYEQQLQGSSASQTDTISKGTIGFGFDISQNFYLSKNFSLRVDWKSRYHFQEVLSYATTTTSPVITRGQVVEESRLVSNSSISIGGTFYFP